MKIIRKTRASAILLLLIFSFNVFYPTVGYALTDGPTAPQTASFEEIDATDMVIPGGKWFAKSQHSLTL